jgi:transposase
MDQHKAKDWREVRRRRAWELKQHGWKQRDIAEALGVTEGAVSQWLKTARAEGVKGLAARKHSGRPPRLTAEQRRMIPELLTQGAEAHGFRGNLWTRARVVVVLRREFGVTHSPQHVGTLLQQCGWSRQQPMRRARQRDELAIANWPHTIWPRLKKSGSRTADDRAGR